MDHCLRWRISLPGYFYSGVKDEGETAGHWFDDKTVRGSHMVVRDKDGKPAPALKLLSIPKGEDFEEVADMRSDCLVGKAGICRAEEDGKTYWMLQGSVAIEGEAAIVTICFHDPSDKEWAMKTWQSISR